MAVSRRTFLAGVTAVAATAASGRLFSEAFAAEDFGLFQTVNRAGQPGVDQATQDKHVPVFTLPAGYANGDAIDVRVSVGKIVHVMTPDHWIESLRVFSDVGQPLAQAIFANDGVAPVVSFRIKAEKGTVLIAQSTCNLHGIWEGRIAL
jgi:superoxide reductase